MIPLIQAFFIITLSSHTLDTIPPSTANDRPPGEILIFAYTFNVLAEKGFAMVLSELIKTELRANNVDDPEKVRDCVLYVASHLVNDDPETENSRMHNYFLHTKERMVLNRWSVLVEEYMKGRMPIDFPKDIPSPDTVDTSIGKDKVTVQAKKYFKDDNFRTLFYELMNTDLRLKLLKDSDYLSQIKMRLVKESNALDTMTMIGGDPGNINALMNNIKNTIKLMEGHVNQQQEDTIYTLNAKVKLLSSIYESSRSQKGVSHFVEKTQELLSKAGDARLTTEVTILADEADKIKIDYINLLVSLEVLDAVKSFSKHKDKITSSPERFMNELEEILIKIKPVGNERLNKLLLSIHDRKNEVIRDAINLGEQLRTSHGFSADELDLSGLNASAESLALLCSESSPEQSTLNQLMSISESARELATSEKKPYYDKHLKDIDTQIRKNKVTIRLAEAKQAILLDTQVKTKKGGHIRLTRTQQNEMKFDQLRIHMKTNKQTINLINQTATKIKNIKGTTDIEKKIERMLLDYRTLLLGEVVKLFEEISRSHDNKTLKEDIVSVKNEIENWKPHKGRYTTSDESDLFDIIPEFLLQLNESIDITTLERDIEEYLKLFNGLSSGEEILEQLKGLQTQDKMPEELISKIQELLHNFDSIIPEKRVMNLLGKISEDLKSLYDYHLNIRLYDKVNNVLDETLNSIGNKLSERGQKVSNLERKTSNEIRLPPGEKSYERKMLVNAIVQCFRVNRDNIIDSYENFEQNFNANYPQSCADDLKADVIELENVKKDFNHTIAVWTIDAAIKDTFNSFIDEMADWSEGDNLEKLEAFLDRCQSELADHKFKYLIIGPKIQEAIDKISEKYLIQPDDLDNAYKTLSQIHEEAQAAPSAS